MPLHATGVGQVLLAHAPDEVQVQVLGSLEPITPCTVVAPGTLRRQLVRTRREGWASTSEEMSLGACSVAVALLRHGEVVAALGLVVATPGTQRPRLLGALQVATGGVTRALGSRA